MSEVRAIPVVGLPEVEEGASLGELIAGRAEIEDGDVVVISQKVVSKAEGQTRRLSSVIPGAEARKLAAVLGKEPALVELILEESIEVLRAERGVLITETHHGFVCANAGIDTSNVPEDDTVCLLPDDPDASARRIRDEIVGEGPGVGVSGQKRGVSGDPYPRPSVIGVVISDSFGRAWRLGQTEVAIGCAGLQPLDDWRGRHDAHGRELEATLISVADEVAAAADLVRGKDSRVPAVVIRGLDRFVTPKDGPGAASLRRPRDESLPLDQDRKLRYQARLADLHAAIEIGLCYEGSGEIAGQPERYAHTPSKQIFDDSVVALVPVEKRLRCFFSFLGGHSAVVAQCDPRQQANCYLPGPSRHPIFVGKKCDLAPLLDRIEACP